MVSQKNNGSISIEQEMNELWELSRRAREENHDGQALEELLKWFHKWRHTGVAGTICGVMEKSRGDHRPIFFNRICSIMGKKVRRPARGPAFDLSAIVFTVALLEKIGMTPAAAKKEAADRFGVNLRSVQIYVKSAGRAHRRFADLTMSYFAERGSTWDNHEERLRLTREEVRKLNEITFREK